MNLTTLIVAKNAGDSIRKTLKSTVGLGSRVFVINDYSTDNTAKIAREYNADVLAYHADGFEKIRTYALSKVTTEWVLILDSDEVLTQENRSEILTAIETKEFNGFYILFRNHLFERKLSHGELHKKLVLFKLSKLIKHDSIIHEQCKILGKVATLKSEAQHYSYRNANQVLCKFIDYSIQTAKINKRNNLVLSFRTLFLYPLHMFYARFIKDEGYKDGPARLFLDLQFAQMEFLSYFLIPFVNAKPRIGIDCGGYAPTGMVQSGINRLIQGIFTNQSKNYDYYWYSFSHKSPNILPRRLFSNLWLPLKTLFNRCDIFLGTGGTIPWILRYFPIKKILFLYDFGFYSSEEKYGSSARHLQTQTNRSVQIADRIVLLNNNSYREFIDRFPQYTHKAEVIVSGADHLSGIEEKPVFIQPIKPLILYVGVVKPVKRIEKILAAVGQSYTVIAGPQEVSYKKNLHTEKNQNIQFIKNLNDGQLKYLYTHADVMVYTSAHEGFCYPVLEALIQGLPVIALRLPIFEMYQNYFSHLTLVDDVEEITRIITQKKFNKVLPSLTHPFKWSLFAENLEEMYRPGARPRLAPRSLGEVGRSRDVEQKVAFIIILYKTSREERNRLEKEIQNSGVSSYEIYWIDNSTNGRGYAAGINEGIRNALKDGCTDFIAMNPDISLSGITAKSISDISSEFHVWGLAMRQNGEIYYGGEIDKWRLSGGLISKKPSRKYFDVDYISASVIGFSKEVVQTIGMWDESYFMYYEDVDYCMRARQAGLQVGIDTETLYDHFEVSQTNKKKDSWIAKSRWKFFWKYSSIKQKIREIIRLPRTYLQK